MVDWCALPEGVLALIARRFQLIEDFIAFRATCSSWRKETTFKDFDKSSCPKLPLLIHDKFTPEDSNYELVSVGIIGGSPEEERKALEEGRAAERKRISDYQREHPVYEREFTSLSKGKSCNFAFPELKGMECHGSNGWLIMAERGIGNMCLFHPLTRAQIPLPEAPPDVDFDFRILKSAALSASPSETPEYVVMIACLEEGYVSGHYVGFWKPGNVTWTRVEIPHSVMDLNYYNGKFYALTWGAQVWMFDVSGLDPDNMASKITELPWECSRPKAQLVECGGRLLAVAPFYQRASHRPYVHDLEMVEIDVIKGSYDTITSLGSSTVFLGYNQGFSIDASRFQGIIEPNLIYFSDGFSRIAAPGPPTDATPHSSCMGIWLNF